MPEAEFQEAAQQLRGRRGSDPAELLGNARHHQDQERGTLREASNVSVGMLLEMC